MAKLLSCVALERPASLIRLAASGSDRQLDTIARRQIERRSTIAHDESIREQLHAVSFVKQTCRKLSCDQHMSWRVWYCWNRRARPAATAAPRRSPLHGSRADDLRCKIAASRIPSKTTRVAVLGVQLVRLE
jgi:hypothetical protein